MRKILIALDSVGIDPLGHDRPESVYSQSDFLFPCGESAPIIEVPVPGWNGVLVETDVVDGHESGAIECAITYASIFSGRSVIREHGLMRELGLNERLLEQLVSSDNLFRHFERSCLANAIFPAHLEFFGNSYVQDQAQAFTREQVERGLRFRGSPICFRGEQKNGFAELFTLAEINQNIFVFAARQAGVPLKVWQDVRQGTALTSSMTHDLENQFDLSFFDQEPLPPRTPEQAANILAALSRKHEFTFYKYQIPDLVSHTGQVDAARKVFALIEQFAGLLLAAVDSAGTSVIITSDHGHLEQLSTSRGHPRSKVPTWYFGAEPRRFADRLQRPEGIFHALVAT
jgi:hypothetical protein